ncbi:MAG TPA: MFS transporter [Acidiferrobacteraceae bacterium]|nr:MFS transporter [Acidiferrobacteraceae bacterium]
MDTSLAALKSGNWRALLACFLYFDTGFTVWLLYGPLAPLIGAPMHLAPAAAGFLVAVPVLSAAILRIGFGNLFQSVSGRILSLAGVLLSAIPIALLPLLTAPSYAQLLVLGVFLGMGGASFAVALPMAASNYPPRVQGLVLGLAAAGNIGAVLDGFLFPPLAHAYGWQHAVAAALPLLAVAAVALWAWGEDRAVKAGRALPALLGFVTTFAGLIVLILGADKGWFGVDGQTAALLLPLPALAVAVGVLPAHYREVLHERDTWVVMLVYSITFGGFVGMSAYVSLLLVALYQIGTVDAGLLMAALASTGALLRPLGGWLADRISGARALRWLLFGIAAIDLVFGLTTPSRTAGIGLLFLLYGCFGLGNGATFQLVPHRWPGRTGVLTGLVGAAGGVGGFYLPVVLGTIRQMTGHYRAGFGVFSALALLAWGLVSVLCGRWLAWSRHSGQVTTAY